jgi:hypothetical protein
MDCIPFDWASRAQSGDFSLKNNLLKSPTPDEMFRSASLHCSFYGHRVLQSAEPKEAVVQRESLEFMSHEATEMRFAVSRTMDKVIGEEHGCGLAAHLAYGKQLTWDRK